MDYVIADQVDAQLFRAYDIRGMVDHSLKPNVVYTIGRAIGSEALARAQPKVVVARDGRLSGPVLLAALTAGLRDAGVDVVDIGMAPTPVLYYATHCLKTQSGVMLTGSHNPSNYNGLKIVLGGHTLSGDEIESLRRRIDHGHLTRGAGRYTSDHTVVAAYQQEITKQCMLERPLTVVVDCGNGVTGEIAPDLFRALGATVVELYTEVDGHFPNHHPDPTRPENLEDLMQAIVTHKADIGLAFDGDGDRLGVVTNRGEIIWADRQMMLFAVDVLARHPGAPIIYDVKSTQHLQAVIEQHGGQPVMWKTGHSLIKAKLAELKAPLAGEMSGHLFFADQWYGFDDGMYTGARLLKILSRSQHSVSALFAPFPDSINTPELHLKLPEHKKFKVMQALIDQAEFPGAEIITMDGLRVHFAAGWGLVRASNTTPCLTLRFEANTAADLETIKDCFREQLQRIDATLDCPF